MEKEFVNLNQILELNRKYNEIGTEIDRVGRLYVQQNCPFKIGQRLKIKGECCIVTHVGFSMASNIKGKGKLCVRPFTKDWKQPKKDRFGKLRSYKNVLDWNLIDDYGNYLTNEQ